MAIEYRGEEILFVVETVGTGATKLLRPFNQTGGSKEISADTIDLDSKDKTGSDYGKVTESLSLEGILTEGDEAVEQILKAIRTKQLVKIYEVKTRDKTAESGMYMISSFNKEYSNGEFATYSVEATLNGAIAKSTLALIPGGAGYDPSLDELVQKYYVIEERIAEAEDRALRNYSDPYDYHASGSSATSKGATVAGSSSVKVSGHDFRVGEGAAIFGAGPVCELPTPVAPKVTTAGVPGSTTYEYRIAVIDGLGGQSPVSPAITISTGNAYLSVANFNRISWDLVPGAVAYVVYGRSNGDMKYVGMTGLGAFNDTGRVAKEPPWTVSPGILYTPSRRILQGRIVEISNEEITLDTASGATLADVTVYHDDTRALQAMIDDSSSRVKEIPEGSFNVFEPLQIPSHTTIRGAGIHTAIIGVTPLMNVIESKNTKNILIERLRVVGNGYGTQPFNRKDDPFMDGAGTGIAIAGGINPKVYDVTISNCGGDGNSSERNGVSGIWFTFGCESHTAIENDVSECRNGINEDNYYQRDPHNGYFARNRIENVRFGLVSDNSDKGRGLRIASNVVKRAAYTAIDINKSSFVRAYDNTLIECGDTINRDYGYWAPETSYAVGDVIQANGRFYKCVTAGTTPLLTTAPQPPAHNKGTGTPDGTVVWERVTGVFSPTIHLYSSGNFRLIRCAIYRNTIIDPFWTGIKAIENIRDCRIEDNDIINGGNHGIQVQSFRYGNVMGNDIINVAGCGIHATPLIIAQVEVSVDRTKFSGNRINGSYQHGMYLESAYYCHIRDNEIFNNSQEKYNEYGGIVITKGTIYAQIHNNTIAGDLQKYGLALLDSNSINNDISGNISRNNASASVDYAIIKTTNNIGMNRATSGFFTGE